MGEKRRWRGGYSSCKTRRGWCRIIRFCSSRCGSRRNLSNKRLSCSNNLSSRINNISISLLRVFLLTGRRVLKTSTFALCLPQNSEFLSPGRKSDSSSHSQLSPTASADLEVSTLTRLFRREFEFLSCVQQHDLMPIAIHLFISGTKWTLAASRLRPHICLVLAYSCGLSPSRLAECNMLFHLVTVARYLQSQTVPAGRPQVECLLHAHHRPEQVSEAALMLENILIDGLNLSLVPPEPNVLGVLDIGA
jgi:hypothetical protein